MYMYIFTYIHKYINMYLCTYVHNTITHTLERARKHTTLMRSCTNICIHNNIYIKKCMNAYRNVYTICKRTSLSTI